MSVSLSSLSKKACVGCKQPISEDDLGITFCNMGSLHENRKCFNLAMNQLFPDAKRYVFSWETDNDFQTFTWQITVYLADKSLIYKQSKSLEWTLSPSSPFSLKHFNDNYLVK